MRTLRLFYIFAKAQFSAFLGGLLDYFIMILLTEYFGIHYTISIVIGGLTGAVVNFLMNRSWTFYSKEFPYKVSRRNQISRFIVVVLNSILLKSTGTHLITTIFQIDYKFSRIITDLFVSVIFNFMLQRFWVFKREAHHESRLFSSDLAKTRTVYSKKNYIWNK